MEVDGGRVETESGLGSNWAELTRECLLDILSRLTMEERWTGPFLTCKAWTTACKDPSLNTVLDLETRFRSSTESSSWWSSEFERKIDSVLRSVVDWSDGGLTVIRVRHCTDRSLSYAAERCPNLEVLWVKSCPKVTDASMAKIASNCPKLKELNVSYCYEISHESLTMLGRNCQNLEILKRNLMNRLDPSQHMRVVPLDYLDAIPQDGNSEAEAIGRNMPQLKHLELQFSTLNAKGLASVCEGCRDLEHLDVFGCVNLTSRNIFDGTVNMKSLKVIKRPNFYIPRSVFNLGRYGHWRLYEDRFQTDVFRI
ncbi:PREDICTED: putative F-box/LRR-repeat protein 19 [Tarenaya hassleriana]|uniref:putative F-box/LRR-repeat protein 19 n=1 Tax=Tarenaya hassleriana TaxID=28532 RepID=UPI00053C7112|nr:PREDICTED: putative F-box/LRR-repeat protein 19 [Tarenaya hassleriana]